MVTQLQGWRGVIAAFLLAVPVAAQLTLSFSHLWPGLREYLTLTQSQVLALDAAFQRISLESDSRVKRREELEVEIFAETARSPLRPAELGRLHSEWEMIRRQLQQAKKDLSHATRAVLSEAQLAKLRAFDEVMARPSVATELNLTGITPVDCAPPRYGSVPAECTGTLIPGVTQIPEFSQDQPGSGAGSAVTAGLHVPLLASYLELSDSQVQRLAESQEKFDAGDETARMWRVAEEIREEAAKETLDSFALGIRFAEIESIRRRMSESRRQQIVANRQLLSLAQAAKLDVLNEAIRLRDTVQEGQKTKLLGSRCEQRLGIFFEETSFGLGYRLFGPFLGDCPDRRALDEPQ